MQTDYTKWVGLAYTVVLGVITLTSIIVLLKYRSETLRENLKDLRDTLEMETTVVASRMDGLVKDLHNVVQQLAIMHMEQVGINQMAAKTLEALVGKVEKIAEFQHELDKRLIILEKVK